MKEEMDERVKNKIKTNKINKERTIINIEKWEEREDLVRLFLELVDHYLNFGHSMWWRDKHLGNKLIFLYL